MASNWRNKGEKKEPNYSKVSYFLNISITSKAMNEQPQPKVRIKIPKLLVKPMQEQKKKKEHQSNDSDDDVGGDANGNRLNRSLIKFGTFEKMFFRDKVTSLFSNVVSKFKNNASSNNCSRCSKISSSFSGGNRDMKEVYCKSCRVLKKIRSIGSFARKELSSRKGVKEQIETDDDDDKEDGEELCKKRILMGERCRPEELCNKRILMGGRCRPENVIGSSSSVGIGKLE